MEPRAERVQKHLLQLLWGQQWHAVKESPEPRAAKSPSGKIVRLRNGETFCQILFFNERVGDTIKAQSLDLVTCPACREKITDKIQTLEKYDASVQKARGESA